MNTNMTVVTLEKSKLHLLREPFKPNQISKLPKPTKKQTDEVKADYKAGIRCGLCGGWHHKDVVHLDYVGHAALTDRLLEVDEAWNWEPMSVNPDGSPKFDAHGGLWIRLTVCGVTRIGYGHPDGKSGGDAFKETIGDALRNAAMRFGAALDLWHKGDLHEDDDVKTSSVESKPEPQKTTNSQQSKPVTSGNDYIINLGDKNKMTGTRLQDHTPEWIKKTMNGTIEYYNKQQKDPHPNAKEFIEKASAYLKTLPNFDSSESIPF